MKTLNQLPLPAHYDPKNASLWDYYPNDWELFQSAQDWAKKNGIKPSGSDRFKLHLLLIDEQNDFCNPRGTLFVAGRSGDGAIRDCERTAEFIYRNLPYITDITATLDSHFAFQIFLATFWVDRNGNPLTPFRFVTTDEIRSGDVKPNPAVAAWVCNGNYPWLMQQVEFYCQELERQGFYKLYLWPPHTQLGRPGHNMNGVVGEAQMFHSYARMVQNWTEVKGQHVLSENYSVLRPEVLLFHDGRPLAPKNERFYRKLVTADAVLIGGQAADKCVYSTIRDLLKDILAEDRSLANKVYIVRDLMSAVVVPGVLDGTDDAERAFEQFQDEGMHVVYSTTPLQDWKDLKLAA